MLRDFFKTIGSFGFYLMAFFVPAILLVVWAQLNLFAALDSNSDKKISFLVNNEWTMPQLGEALEKQGLIRNSAAVTFLGKYKLSKAKGQQIEVVPGEYQLSPNMKPEEILKKFIAGDVKLYEVSFPPGQTIEDVANTLSSRGLVTVEDAMQAIKDRSMLATLGIPSYIPEGFFTEGTYQVTRPSKATELIETLLLKAEKRLKELVPDWRTRAKNLGFLPYDILKIASLVEKETSNPEERKIVASMYHNRYRIGLALQSDEALKYGNVSLRVQGVSDAARKEPGPYNTYVSKNLPLTPICSPSAAAVEAALAPADTDFLYKTPKGDGTHDFSTHLKQHIRKVKAYRAKILAE